MSVANFVLLIYLGAGFSNGKGLGELLSPLNLYGFIFWLYIGFLVFLFFAVPNQKQGQEIKERLKKEEGEFKVLCLKNSRRAYDMTFGKGKSNLYSEWYWDMQSQEKFLRGLAIKIEEYEGYVKGNKKNIAKAKNEIWRIKNRRKYYGSLWEMEEEIKEQEEIIRKAEERIKGFEEEIKKNTEKLNKFGYDRHVQPLPPLTWDDVHDYIRKERSMFFPRKIDKDED